MSGIEQLSIRIIEGLANRLPEQRKTQRDKLGLLVATMLEVRSANLMDLAASLPRPIKRLDKRSQWIERFLSNDLVDVNEGMAPFAREVFSRIVGSRQRLVLMIDQTQASIRHQILMVSVGLGGRALPVA